LVRRPFLLSRLRWAAVLLALALLDAASWLFAPWQVAGALMVPPVVVVGVLAHWWWLGRGKDPIVFVSIFHGQSFKGREAAETHFGALASFLQEDAILAEVGPIAVRKVSIPLNPKQAERLLRISGALLVVRGSGDAIQDVSRWEWWGHFKEERPEVMLTADRYSVRSNESEKGLIARVLRRSATTEEAHAVEGDLALARFVETELKIDHFRILSMIICVLASRTLFSESRNSTDGVMLVLPEPASAKALPASLRGQVAMLEAVAERSRGDDLLDILKRLHEMSRQGIGDSVFGVWVSAQWFVATVERRVSLEAAMSAGMEIVERFPDDPEVLLNAAGLAVQAKDFQLGEEMIGRAEEVTPRSSGISRLRANIAWMSGDPEAALKLYRQAARRGCPQTWQIGDCHANLRHPRRALRCYRKTLRRDPTAGHALRHARTVRQIPRILPTLPGDWRDQIWRSLHEHPQLVRPAMMIWRNRRPEDPWLGAWLGRQALVRGNLHSAKRWLSLGTRIEDTNRLVPLADSIIVARLLEEGDLKTNVETLREHLSWMASSGFREPEVQAEAILVPLWEKRADILDGEVGAELRAGFQEAHVSLP
jgi:tetratricopeptide (TPR) repeat protein